MANEADHIALANRNHDSLQFLMTDAARHPEWIATISFYKALQLVEALFAKEGIRCSSHDVRLLWLKKPAFDPAIHRHYRSLWNASTIARYLGDLENAKGYRTFADYLPADRVVEHLVIGRLKPIEDAIVARLSTKLQTTLRRISPT